MFFTVMKKVSFIAVEFFLKTTCSSSQRIILLFWTMAMLILIQYFGAVMISILHPHNNKNFINTLDDLERIAECDTRKIVTPSKPFFINHFFNSTHTQLQQKLKDHFNR